MATKGSRAARLHLAMDRRGLRWCWTLGEGRLGSETCLSTTFPPLPPFLPSPCILPSLPPCSLFSPSSPSLCHFSPVPSLLASSLFPFLLLLPPPLVSSSPFLPALCSSQLYPLLHPSPVGLFLILLLPSPSCFPSPTSPFFFPFLFPPFPSLSPPPSSPSRGEYEALSPLFSTPTTESWAH